MKKIIILLFNLTILTGCNKIYTVDNFIKDTDLRKNFLSKCQNGELHPEDINCINVLKADEFISLEKDKRKVNVWN